MRSGCLFFLFLIGIQATLLQAQILNVDREILDSMPKNWYGLISGSLSQDKQKFDIQAINLYTESVIKRKNGTGITYVGQVDATVSGKQILQNDKNNNHAIDIIIV